MEDITGILVDLFVLFAAAKAAGELFTRMRQPPVVGEVLVGVIILLFFVGLETRLSGLLEVGKRAAFVGVLGVAFPFVLGFALVWATDPTNSKDLEIEAAFVATAMVARSIGT